MSVDFAMPQMGFDMTEAKIAHWAKAEGERVEPGEVLAEIATEKVNLELVDHPGGVIEKLLVPEGETVAVGTPIVRFGETAGGEPPAAADGASGGASPKAEAAPKEEAAPRAEAANAPDQKAAEAPQGEETPAAGADVKPAQPAGQAAPANAAAGQTPERLSRSPGETPAGPPEPAESAPVDQAPPEQAAPKPGSSEQPAAQPAPGQQQSPQPAPSEQPAPQPGPANGAARLRVSPLARRIAEQKGVDLSRVKGSGPEGRIQKDDVLEYAQAHAAPRPAPAPNEPTPVTSAPVAPTAGIQELSPMRQAIARRMQESKQQIPHFYVAIDVRMDAVLALREDLTEAAGDDLKITINDFIIKATAAALQRHPSLNAWFLDGKIKIHDRVNIGIAIALEDGLIVPALLDCQNRSLGKISSGAQDLAKRARKGSLKPEEFTGGTFTISNLGMFGVSEFQAILNPPQVGILAIGAAQKQPVVDGDRLAVGTIMKVYLSCDHRATDGAAAAKFLADLKRFLENPMLMIL